MAGGGFGGGGGMLMGGLVMTFEEPEPCADEPAKTYYKCRDLSGVGGGSNYCNCECPPGKRYFATGGICIDDDTGASGRSTSSSSATATSVSELSETQRRQKDEIESDTREKQGKPDPAPRNNTPQIQGYRKQTEEDRAIIDSVLEGTPQGELRDMIEKAAEIKDVTDRPDDKIRKFTVDESSANLEQKAYGNFYSRYRVDFLGEQGTEIRKDKYEVIYSGIERQFLEHQFGLTLPPAQHQRVINNVFLTFADEMLKTQVRTVETFSHINQANFSNSLITSNNLSDSAASIKPKFSTQEAEQLAMLQAAGVFGTPKNVTRRAFGRNNSQDPFGIVGSQPTILGGRGDKGMNLFKYASSSRASISAKTKFSTGPGSFKIGPGGFRMELGSNLRMGRAGSPAMSAAKVTRSSPGSYAKASMNSRANAKKPTSGLQKSMQGFKQRSKALTMSTSSGNKMGTRKMGRPSGNQTNMNPSPNKTMNPNRSSGRKTNNYNKSTRNKGGNY
jgi:hypothetical protein